MMLAENMRLTHLVLANSQIDRRALETIAWVAPRLVALTFVRCVFVVLDQKALGSAFSGLGNLRTLSLLECNDLPLEVAKTLFPITSHLHSFALCSNRTSPLILSNFHNCSLEYLIIESYEQFSPDLSDIARILDNNRHCLIGLGLNGILKGPLRLEKFWNHFHTLQLAHLAFVNLGMTRLDDRKLSSLHSISPRLVLLEASLSPTDLVRHLSSRNYLKFLLAWRVDQQWLHTNLHPNTDYELIVNKLVQRNWCLKTLWMLHPFLCSTTGRVVASWFSSRNRMIPNKRPTDG